MNVLEGSMRRLLALLLIPLGLGLAGCATPGGFIGQAADSVMPAPTKSLQLFRASAAYALSARAAAATNRSSDGAVAVLRRMIAVRNDLNELAWRAYHTPCSDDLSRSCREGYRQTFEARLPTLHNNLYHLFIAGIPVEEFKPALPDLLAGDVIGLLEALRKPTEILVGSAFQVGGVYRSELEVFATLVAMTKQVSPPMNSKDADALIKQHLPTPADYVAIGQAIDALPNPAQSGYFDAVYAMVRDSCEQLTARMVKADLDSLKLIGIDSCGDFKLEPTLGKYKPGTKELIGYPSLVPAKKS